MHEYSVLQSLIERVEIEKERHDATSVGAIHLRIGEHSGVEVELLERAWTLFEELPEWSGTRLHVETVPACWSCPSCGREMERGAILRCADCQLPARMVSGDEIVLQRIEMEANAHV